MSNVQNVRLASHPGGSRNTPIASCYRNQDKLWPGGPQLAGMQTLLSKDGWRMKLEAMNFIHMVSCSTMVFPVRVHIYL